VCCWSVEVGAPNVPSGLPSFSCSFFPSLFPLLFNFLFCLFFLLAFWCFLIFVFLLLNVSLVYTRSALAVYPVAHYRVWLYMSLRLLGRGLASSSCFLCSFVLFVLCSVYPIYICAFLLLTLHNLRNDTRLSPSSGQHLMQKTQHRLQCLLCRAKNITCLWALCKHALACWNPSIRSFVANRTVSGSWSNWAHPILSKSRPKLPRAGWSRCA
jgi:hypothetical protein